MYEIVESYESIHKDVSRPFIYESCTAGSDVAHFSLCLLESPALQALTRCRIGGD